MSTISRDNSERVKKKKLRLDSKFWARVLVIILALTMLAGTFYYVLVFTIAGSRVEAVAAEEDDPLMRIALVYGSSVTVDYITVADCGFSLGFTDSDNQFTEVLATDVTTLNVALDKNLTKSGTRYGLAADGTAPDVGAYHIRVAVPKETFSRLLDRARTEYADYGVFPAYYDGANYLMIGDFSTETAANEALAAILQLLPPPPAEEETTDSSEADTSADPEETTAVSDETTSETTDGTDGELDDGPAVDPYHDYLRAATVRAPSATAVTVIDPATHDIVWEFDCTDKTTFMGAKARQTGSSYTYIRGYKGTTRYTYDGVLECAPYTTGDVTGIKVINILPLETYITGVIPYEIGNSWPLETQKAFAIAVRSYAISNIGRHKKSYNADLCSSSDCQVYKGFGSTNAKVRQAASETKGKIAVYNGTGDICITAYSSSTGGCTANAWDVWGSSRKTYGYLAAVATPWERYTKYGNGSWSTSVTGKQLYERLEAKGYTALTSAVTDITITKLGENSTYVYEIRFADKAGHTVTVKQGNKVKSLLSPYVNSGNFVVAKAGETVTRNNYTMLGFGATASTPTIGMVIQGNPLTYILYGRQNFHVVTGSGTKTFTDSPTESVATAKGILPFDMTRALDALFYPTVTGVNGAVLPDIMKLDPILETETLTAEGDSGSFVFIGRGWGHGVGLSQWGTKDLGDLGYDYETIFKAYYSDVRIVNFRDYLNGVA